MKKKRKVTKKARIKETHRHAARAKQMHNKSRKCIFWGVVWKGDRAVEWSWARVKEWEA